MSKPKSPLSLDSSLGMQRRASRLIPGMTQLLSKRPDMFSLGVWPGYFSRAAGAEVWDLDGNRYVDMSLGGIGANALGYADPDVDQAVVRAVASGTSCSLNCPEEVELAERLVGLHPWAGMARFARTGGEAMAVAVRIARAHTGRDTIAFCGYHGWHDWYLAANLGDTDSLDGHLLPGLAPAGVPRGLRGTALPFRYNRIEELSRIVAEHGDSLAAIVMEPLRNDLPEGDFLGQVRRLADTAGAVLVFDEISIGFRLTTGGAHLVVGGVSPDMAVFSKALGNGYPMAAILGREAVMRSTQKTFISSTYWTERIGPSAALAVIDKFERLDVPAHLARIGSLVQRGWREAALAHGLDIQVGGLPPMGHFSFGHAQAQAMKACFIQHMLEEGYLASNLFYAMWPHTEAHVAGYLEAVDKAFAETARVLARGDFEAVLRGRPAQTGFTRLN
ncbi:Glutamate-1-semialdehyde 2,1-aminomutase (plasmid) [Solidesulfovibrio carbinoliphilus subsp. oakridgensis]|uniref:Glutamate-1-semialdehyde 2,1-aminomutase n=1 Tax=Solidesulfovibrio carbinoliphilus subsp. oakridgensis TaxID=694327 RepID=G7QE69_9BACT|nr:aminotransferase class III-fold pyridoxal phosphate-dependent enzyme [Solidesulfovibrio carbinoliphilus]EHJ45963.1 Glutamate-1-semialdehyde 2,1-aminomutase [Solidesulfovibrio carbinoliphilus subsp. oakridgensis]